MGRRKRIPAERVVFAVRWFWSTSTVTLGLVFLGLSTCTFPCLSLAFIYAVIYSDVSNYPHPLSTTLVFHSQCYEYLGTHLLMLPFPYPSHFQPYSCLSVIFLPSLASWHFLSFVFLPTDILRCNAARSVLVSAWMHVRDSLFVCPRYTSASTVSKPFGI